MEGPISKDVVWSGKSPARFQSLKCFDRLENDSRGSMGRNLGMGFENSVVDAQRSGSLGNLGLEPANKVYELQRSLF